MLKEVIKEIKDSNYISKWAIAQKLNTSESLVEDAFAQLIRMEYIVEDNTKDSCNISCNKCPYSKLCNKIPIKTMMITEKGEKLLEEYF